MVPVYEFGEPCSQVFVPHSKKEKRLETSKIQYTPWPSLTAYVFIILLGVQNNVARIKSLQRPIRLHNGPRFPTSCGLSCVPFLKW